jgi:SAM-dependent methyltransferase
MGEKMKKIERPRLDSKAIDDMARGHQIAQVLFTAMRCGLFDRLKEERSAAEVAREVEADPVITEKLLNTLVCLGLVRKEGGRYQNAELARAYLMKESCFYQGNLIDLVGQGYPLWGNLQQALKGNGAPGPAKRDKGGVFDKGFTYSMAEGARRGPLHRTIDAVCGLAEFKKARTLLDLGGGHGLYAIAFAQENPGLASTVFDIPPVAGVAREFIERHGMPERVRVVAGDYLKDEFPERYDIVFVSDVFYQSRDQLQAPLQKIYRALNPGGLLIMKHWVMNEERTGGQTVVFWDLWLSLLGFPHYVFTRDEYAGLLKDLGFAGVRMIDIASSPDPSAIVIGKKEAEE